MVEFVTVAAIAFLLGGIVGSVLPMVPAGGLSLVGVALYFFAGPAEGPRLGLLAFLVLAGVAVATVAVEHLSGALASKAGGAETSTVILAAVASLLLFFVLGPLGIVVGTALTVLGAELYAGKEPTAAVRAAVYTVAGLLASTVAQFALTLSILVGFLVVVFVV